MPLEVSNEPPKLIDFDLWAKNMAAAATERGCTSRFKKRSYDMNMTFFEGIEAVGRTVVGGSFQILQIQLHMNKGGKFSVTVDEKLPLVKFFEEGEMERMLAGDIETEALKQVDIMIWYQLIFRKRFAALGPILTMLHTKGQYYLDFEKTRTYWARGGPLMSVDEVLLRLAKIVPVDIFNRRFMDKIDYDVQMHYFERDSVKRGLPFSAKEFSGHTWMICDS